MKQPAMAFVHDTPAVRVLLRIGALREVAGEARKLGRRVLLIADEAIKAAADVIATDLGAMLAGRIDEVIMHVPVEQARAAVAYAREIDANTIVAIGGGSATGLAKAIAKELHLPITAVPTTYAGSEMTPIWGLTEQARKTTGRDPHVLPRTVVYDPALTAGLSAQVTAASGMNAIAHCVEGMYSSAASPVTSLLAEEGVRALAAALPRAVTDPADLTARSEAQYGAWLAGWVLGTTGMGIHHKICHVLGGTYNLPHAPAHSAVLAYATAYNADYAPAAMTRLARALGSAGAAAGIWDLARRIGAPTSLAAVGFRETDADEAAALVTATPFTNPRPVDREGVRELLLAACRGDRPQPGHSPTRSQNRP
jgi:alcohol dehydrogenase class IV